MKRAATRRGEIAYDVVGEGPAVVLVHGTPSRSLVWRRIAPELAAAGFRVYTYDLLGFGGSERHVDQDVSLVAHGQVLKELVEDHWRIAEPPALVGHDIGGAVALRAHLIEGVPVERIALIDAVVLAPFITDRTRELRERGPRGDLATEIEEHLRTATSKRLDDDVYDALFGQWSGAEGEALYMRNIEQFDEDHTRDFEPRLGELDMPILILWGEDDTWLPVEGSERIEQRLPNARRYVIPGAGHFSMEDAPEALASRLREFLGERRG